MNSYIGSIPTSIKLKKAELTLFYEFKNRYKTEIQKFTNKNYITNDDTLQYIFKVIIPQYEKMKK